MVNGASMFILMSILGFRINISESYPLGVYKRFQGHYEKNSLVESCLPEEVANLMVERQYIPDAGNCGGYPAIIKKIYAVGGDVVEVNEKVTINGQVIPNSQLLEFDSQGRPLNAARGTTVGDDQVWLMSNIVTNSFDARYFGETPSDLIVTKLRPLWTVK